MTWDPGGIALRTRVQRVAGFEGVAAIEAAIVTPPIEANAAIHGDDIVRRQHKGDAVDISQEASPQELLA